MVELYHTFNLKVKISGSRMFLLLVSEGGYGESSGDSPHGLF